MGPLVMVVVLLLAPAGADVSWVDLSVRRGDGAFLLRPCSGTARSGTLTAVLALGLQVPLIGIPVGLAIHGACYWLNKRDPYFFDALGRHIRQKPYLDA